MSRHPALRRRGPMYAFVFVGALLLFGLEPLVGRLLLPRFGGGFHVWTTTLMFFQGALVLAYAYAHLAAARAGAWHLLLVALPLVFLPPSIGDAAATSAELSAILLLLIRHVLVPFSVLATTAVVAQRWWASRNEAPYSLYAVSNLGSLGALVLYALVIEPSLGLEAQRWGWAAGYVLYMGLAVLAYRSVRPTRPAPNATTDPPPPATSQLYWCLLSAAPSAFLMAVTNLIALDAGNVPLVWIVPLVLYLASFVIAFGEPADGETSRVPRTVRRLWPHIAATGLFFFTGGDAGGGWLDVAVHLVVLAFIALAAHGELHRVRPAPAHLTRYYLVMALGGWLGGAFVALVAPTAFDGLWEYPAALGLLVVTMAVGRRVELRSWLGTAPKMALLVSLGLVVVIVGKVALAHRDADPRQTLAVERSFYGLYRVTRAPDGVTDLVSGNTRHGRQRVGDLTPLSYYHPAGPLGDVMARLPAPRRAGVVGLGVGAAAGHFAGGDRVEFFEIDPVVERLARAHFSYLSGTAAEVEVHVGDARVALESSRATFDLLFIDAFAGDAIPTHLLTLEALRLYLDRTPNGVVLLHVSNRYYELGPVLARAAVHLGVSGAQVSRDHGLEEDQDAARCVVLSNDPSWAARLIEEAGWTPLSEQPALRGEAWTDDHADLFDAVRWVAF
ncbi:MAG: fused MFS/spermidine synthase [Sandaracinaceae bacterium]